MAVFNLGEAGERVSLAWSDLGISGTVKEVRDLWSHTSLDALDAVHVALQPHASVLYLVTSAPSQ